MAKLSNEIVKKLYEFTQSRRDLVRAYEGKDQLETAYLARWAILEKFVKIVVTEFRKEELERCLKEWLDYVEGKRTKQPSKNPNTNLETKNLPLRSEFIEALNHFGFDGIRVWKVMDSKGKARAFRNQIAHTGRKFTRRVQYTKLGNQLESVTKATLGA